MTTQSDVFNHVVERGYLSSWTLEEFLARQLAKLQEELSEALASSLDANNDRYIPYDVQTIIKKQPAMKQYFDAVLAAGHHARNVFDLYQDPFNPDAKQSVWIAHRINEIAAELTDAQVVLFCAAEALNKLLLDGFNISSAAYLKSKRDVDRGVRAENKE